MTLSLCHQKDEDEFIVFLGDLKRALGGLLLHINVHAKSADLPTNPIVGAYDYREIGRIADIVAVMTIDYGCPTGPPDPISPDFGGWKRCFAMHLHISAPISYKWL